MKLPSPIYVVCDANGEFKGAYTTETAADKVAHYYGAYVNEVQEVKEQADVPEAV